MKYEIIDLNKDGSGSVRFHLDDESTIGQLFQGAPIEDAPAMDAFMAALGDDLLRRLAPVVEKNIAPEVAAKVGTEVIIERSVKP